MMKGNPELEDRIRRAIRFVVPLLVMLWTVGIVAANLPHYVRSYGWFCMDAVVLYVVIAGSLVLALSIVCHISTKPEWFLRCLEASSTLFFVASVMTLIGEGFKGDFYPVLLLLAAIVYGLRIGLDVALLRRIKKHLSPAALNTPNSEQATRLKLAAFATLWIGVGQFIILVVLRLTKAVSLENLEITSLVVGCLFIFLWRHVKKCNQIALLLAVILTVLLNIWDAVWVIRVLSKGGLPLGLGSIGIRAVILIWMIRGLRTMRELKPGSPDCYT